MNNNQIVFHFFEPETSKVSEKKKSKISIKKKREPNMFISYRKEMMRYKPYNMAMTKYSKLVSKWWRNLSENEKTKWQRKYQINRDQNLQNTVNTDNINTTKIIESSNPQTDNVTNYPVSKGYYSPENEKAKWQRYQINRDQTLS